MAEREIGPGKAGASCWVETLLEATNAAGGSNRLHHRLKNS